MMTIKPPTTPEDAQRRETFRTCPKCLDKNRRGCTLCAGTGLVTKSEARAWKSANPAKLR